MTEFQNRRQHWIFPFSVGVTNVQHVASLSLRFVFEKADEQCAEVKPALLPVSPLYYDRPHWGGRKGGSELGPHPFIKKDRRKLL